MKKKFVDILMMKNACAAGLADAEQKCYDWESALQHTLSETEVQKISKEHIIVDTNEANTVRGQYMAAITSIRMQDFCMPKRIQVVTVKLSSNSHR